MTDPLAPVDVVTSLDPDCPPEYAPPFDTDNPPPTVAVPDQQVWYVGGDDALAVPGVGLWAAGEEKTVPGWLASRLLTRRDFSPVPPTDGLMALHAPGSAVAVPADGEGPVVARKATTRKAPLPGDAIENQ